MKHIGNDLADSSFKLNIFDVIKVEAFGALKRPVKNLQYLRNMSTTRAVS